MKKLNIITPSVSQHGGMALYMSNLTKHLSKEYELTVYCLKYDKKTLSAYPNIRIEESKVLRRFPRFLMYYIFALKIYFKTRHQTNISAARIFNPTIMIVGGTHKQHNIVMQKKGLIYDCIEIFLEKKSYQNSESIIAHSPLMTAEINDYKLNVDNKIHMLYPPVELSKFSFKTPSQKTALRTKLDLPKDKYLILITGTEDRRKGVPEAVKAITELGNEYYLMIFGSTYKLSLPENAKHFGAVDNIDEYYAAADVTLMPSIYEPFGLVVIESLETGTPVILSDRVGATGLVNNKNSIIIDGEPNAKAITKALKLSRNKKWQLSKNFLKELNLNWENHITEIKKLLP